MAQSLTTDFPIDPTATSGTDLADILNRWHQAGASGHSGLTRPAGLAAGGLWTQQTAGGGLNLMFYDGTSDQKIAGVSAPGSTITVGEDNSVAMAILFGA